MTVWRLFALKMAFDLSSRKRLVACCLVLQIVAKCSASAADEADCGRAPLNKLTKERHLSGYIVGGEAQEYGEWPSYIAVYTSLPNGKFKMCGGVLIGRREVLTAAHCVLKKTNGGEEFDAEGGDAVAEQLLLVSGKNSFRELFRDKYEQVHLVASICASKSFNATGRHEDDYAILKLRRTINEFDEHLQPACLPDARHLIDLNADELSANFYENSCFGVGLGVVGYVEDPLGYKKLLHPKRVQKLQLEEVPRSRCKKAWRSVFELDKSQLCLAKFGSSKAGDSAKKPVGSLCHGDSGGPVLCLSRKLKRWTVVGITSLGDIDCRARRPMILMNVRNVLPTIRSSCKLQVGDKEDEEEDYVTC